MKTVEPPSTRWSSEQGTEVPVNVTVQPRSPSHAAVEFPALSFSLPPVRTKRFQGAALAAAAFILSGVALLFMCKRLSSNLAEVGLPHRRLAESNKKDGTSDEELDAILTECLELEAEHGEPPSDTDLMEPAAKRAKLVAFLEEAASSFESKGQQSALPKQWSPQPPSWTFADELRSIGATHPGGPQSPGEILVDETSIAGLSAFESTSGPGLGVIPELDPEAFLDQIPPLVDRGGEEGRELVGTTVSDGGEDQQEPSTSGAVPGDLFLRHSPRDQRLGPEGHPFFRLPAVLPGAVRRQFRVLDSYFRPYSGRSPFPMLERMRGLFLRTVLGPDEVEELMCAAEALVCYARYHWSADRGSIYSPAHVLRHLGTEFLILDCLVCARQLLGPQMISDQWWDEIMANVRTDFDMMALSVFANAQTRHNHALVRRLIPAVSLLKTGVRPGARDIVDLKRMLICSSHSEARFRESRWNPWRKDDETYAQTHGDSSDDFADERS